MATEPMLIGDIGGTNARFALANPDKPGFSQVRKLACADFATAEDAIVTKEAQAAIERPQIMAFTDQEITLPTQSVEGILEPEGVKVYVYPESSSSLQIRLENPSETLLGASPAVVDLDSMAVSLWTVATGSAPTGFEITEMALTGSMTREERDARKLTWNKEVVPEVDIPDNKEDPTSAVTLTALEMRTFRVTYTEPAAVSE